MCKQALSGLPLDFRYQSDAKTQVLNYPQRALVASEVADDVGLTENPAGQAFVVAIRCCRDNQEDSLIINEGSIERGAGCSTYFRTFRDIETSHGSDLEVFTNNQKGVTGKRKAVYDGLDGTGTQPVGAKVTKNMVLIGKTIDFAQASSHQGKVTSSRVKRDRSTVYRSEEPATVHSVAWSYTKEGLKAVALKVGSLRVPEVGDKFSSRHGQKGIVGQVVPQENMAFTASGITPDLIINNHAIPSRMTAGQLIESVLGVLSCQKGRVVNGTPFAQIPIGDLPSGKERMINGMTGEMLEGSVTIGVVFYQRLRHMVADKINARSTGPRQIFNRQPQEGRTRRGGLRFGEMERDALVAHGASSFIMDRYLHHSDPFWCWCCAKCGFLAEAPAPADTTTVLHARAYCRFCRSSNHVKRLLLPYTCKLLVQILSAVHIAMRFKLQMDPADLFAADASVGGPRGSATGSATASSFSSATSEFL